MSFGAERRPRRRFHVAAIIPTRIAPRCPNPHSPASPRAATSLDIYLPAHLYLNGCLIKDTLNHTVSSNKTFRALADPTRREILGLLRHGEITAGALAEKFDMTKPAMSHHFSVLKEADLITSRRDGQQIWYGLNTTVVQDIMAWAIHLIGDGKKSRGKQR